jgi:hypothetical protein
MYKITRITVLYLLLALLPIIAQAQDDHIFMHSGKVVPAKILTVEKDHVKFLYLGMETLSCGKYAIERIEYAHGTIEQMSKKIIVSSKADWEKVVILNTTETISELKYKGFVGDVKAPVTPEMLAKDKSLERKIKEQAAEMGCPFVLVNAKKNVAYNYN